MNGKVVVELKSKDKQKEVVLTQNVIIGNRIPKDFFMTTAPIRISIRILSIARRSALAPGSRWKFIYIRIILF